MFELEAFLKDCRDAVANDPTHSTARDIAARAVAEPTDILRALGEPTRAGFTSLYHSDTLTVLNVIWGPSMNVLPHNHNMWAVIAVYAGREDNIFWRQIEDENGPTIEAAGAKSLTVKDAEPLGPNIVHSVVNPSNRLTAAIHIYGGDFFGEGRLEWDSDDHRPRPFDIEQSRKRFEQSNRLL